MSKASDKSLPLIILESPTKIKTLKKFLEGSYTFDSSKGHIRDLPDKGFGIDLKDDLKGEFDVQYVDLSDKASTIADIKAAAKKASIVYLAPDPDREGEAIAWHIASILPKGVKYKRVTFNALTKSVVEESLKHPREIDLNLVNSQQARRLLDRIVGYKISPILTRRLLGGKRTKGGGASAGRVQSVALKIVVEREKEIEAFIPTEYWVMHALFKKSAKDVPFSSFLLEIDGKKIVKTEEEIKDPKKQCRISTEKEAKKIEERLKKGSYQVTRVEKKEKKRNASPPFITSTLQQEASRHFGFSPTRTMSIAQKLYESGHITYMRTDSTRVDPSAIKSARDYIGKKYGKDHLPETPNLYASKKSAQDGHEAIRPSEMSLPPEKLKDSIEEQKVYTLIWNRFVASQMNPALFDTLSCDIEDGGGLLLRATGSVLKFKGFLAVYQEKKEENEKEDEEKTLPPLVEGEKVLLDKIDPKQSFTQPPPRFTEASLIKKLEEDGIGRPSTYASIISKIESRDYTSKEKGALKPTEFGKIAEGMLSSYFAIIMDIGFTRGMEEQLEKIEEGEGDWRELLRGFWKLFKEEIALAEKEAIVPTEKTTHICPKCGGFLEKSFARGGFYYRCSNFVKDDPKSCDYKVNEQGLNFNKEDYETFDDNQICPKCQKNPMTLRFGPMGAFLGCSGYPECKGIISLRRKDAPKEVDMPPCVAEGCTGKLRMGRSRFGIFYSCTEYPRCDVIGNSLDKVQSKFAGRPKTPAAPKSDKKVKGKKGASTKNSAFSAPQKLSSSLREALDIKEESLPRAEVQKILWAYIKKHDLQDAKNRRIINPDKQLKILFKEPVDMFKLPGILAEHIGDK